MNLNLMKLSALDDDHYNWKKSDYKIKLKSSKPFFSSIIRVSALFFQRKKRVWTLRLFFWLNIYFCLKFFFNNMTDQFLKFTICSFNLFIIFRFIKKILGQIYGRYINGCMDLQYLIGEVLIISNRLIRGFKGIILWRIVKSKISILTFNLS